MRLKNINKKKNVICKLRQIAKIKYNKKTLNDFIKKNLNMNFIQSIFFLYSTLIFFVKKQNKLLYFCINFCSLNYITKKNCYPLLLIFNLFNSFYKA